ncbi:MAG: Rhodanese-related sulfurtransferase [Phormidesmis priestleyi Ana]|uniref:Rhodanese-related sulfurtransferase n=1 Tax=Phormidesmis priestleyi Ana TaxID=1666911 RepID=A0A0P7ZT09_9CYAN|nr:MAG: Rhodanese-related sulfurtransferase [Phormidesmis priestleyi Ana]
MTKHFIAWVIGWIYACVLLGILPMPLAVASPLQTGLKSLQQLNQPSTPTIDNSRSFSAVETFLTSLPSDYYTLKQVDRLKEIVQNKAALLIDVREPNEFKAGHIEGALNIPLRSLTHHLGQIPQTQPVILYCSSGYRTGMGVMALKILGYDNVQGFPPSIQGWKASGGKLVVSK